MEQIRYHNSTSLDPIVRNPAVSPAKTTLSQLLISNERDVKLAWRNAITNVNTTSDRLGEVASRVAQVQSRLVTTNWAVADHKELGDQLLTAAKDLYGYARSQLFALNGFRNSMKTLIETKLEVNGENLLYLVDERHPNTNQVTLPAACTEALIPLMRTNNRDQETQSLYENERKISATEINAEHRTRADHYSIPSPHTISALEANGQNTPESRFPEFNQDEWVDANDEYHQDYHLQDEVEENTRFNDSFVSDHETNLTDSMKSESFGLGETRLQID